MSVMAEDQPPGWLVYFGHDDLDAGVEQVKALGGSLEVGPMEVGEAGRIAILKDPQGAYFALYSGRFDD